MSSRFRGAATRTGAVNRVLAALLLLALSPGSALSESGFQTVSGPCRFQFPEDHAAHPDFKTEWWYYTGNLKTAEGRRFGYQLTFFRSQTAPSGAKRRWPDPASGWRTLQIYLAHLAVSDIRGETHRQAETMARGALDMAGVDRRGETVRVFLRDWSAELGPEVHTLRAETPEMGLALDLAPLKPPVPHGEDGYDRKGQGPESASCYYSLTRLRTTGRMRVGDAAFSVSGLSWMDHEYSTAPLEPGIAGWDWFSLQLDDGTELMAYFLRESDGGFSPASSATFVDREGEGTPIGFSGIRLETTAIWKSPDTGAAYPAGWILSVPALALTLSVSPALADQEMETPLTTDVAYWEGAVAVEGTSGDRPVGGRGYVELTGYDRAFDAEM